MCSGSTATHIDSYLLNNHSGLFTNLIRKTPINDYLNIQYVAYRKKIDSSKNAQHSQ